MIAKELEFLWVRSIPTRDGCWSELMPFFTASSVRKWPFILESAMITNSGALAHNKTRDSNQDSTNKNRISKRKITVLG